MLNRKVYKKGQNSINMPIKIYKNDIMFKLKSKFIIAIFERARLKFGGSEKASQILNIPYSSFRAYKNGYISALPKKLINRLLKELIISRKELRVNVLSTYYRDEQNQKLLERGRKIRHRKLKEWKEDIPKLKEILNNGEIDFKKWFSAYQKLINFGARKFNYIKEKNDFLEISYITHSNKIKKEFVLKFPKSFLVDDEFLYFFGLWCGDRSGGKRFGVCNKNEAIINFTQDFLFKYYQNVERILYITKIMEEPKLSYDKKFVIDKEIKGWVLSIHSNNGVLSSFFYYLQSNLDEFLEKTENKYAFFAGLFDAEGNVSLHNKSFRIACQNLNLVKIYSKFLEKLKLFDRYDGECIITYNKDEFYKRILPYLKNKEKINLSQIMCKGKGELPKEYLDILKEAYLNPNSSSKDIAKALKKNKVYSELKLLSDFGFISLIGYPHLFKITNKGLKSLGD
jgi:hypothetical protein